MGVDVPQQAITTLLQEHVAWEKQISKRSTPEYRKYKYNVLYMHYLYNAAILNIMYIYRSHLKHQANQHHEEEKDYMLTRQAVGVGTAFCDGDSAVQLEVQAADEEADEEHNEDDVGCSDDIMFPLEELCSSDDNGGYPVLFLYDCEATGGSIYKDHIIEVASSVIEPNGVFLSVTSFSSLCRSSRHICKIG